jgi:hypothetical protein
METINYELEWKPAYENLMTLAEALELVESLKDEQWRLPTKTELLDFYWKENGFLNGYAEYFALEDLDETTTFQQVIQVRPKDLKSTLVGKKDKNYLKLCKKLGNGEKLHDGVYTKILNDLSCDSTRITKKKDTIRKTWETMETIKNWNIVKTKLEWSGTHQLHTLKEGQRFLFIGLSANANSIIEATIIENVFDYVKLQYTNTHAQWVKVEEWDKEYKIVRLLEVN